MRGILLGIGMKSPTHIPSRQVEYFIEVPISPYIVIVNKFYNFVINQHRSTQ